MCEARLWSHAYRTKNIHCVSIYIVCEARLWSHAYRTKNIHCVWRIRGVRLIERRIYIVFLHIRGVTLIERRIYIVCGAFEASRL